MNFLNRFSQKLGNLINALILIFLLLGLLELISPTIKLNDARQNINEFITSKTGRSVQIDGDIELKISISPQLLIKRIHIRNPEDFDKHDLLTVNEIRIEVPLLPLLQGELNLSNTSADGARLNLHKKADDSNNWSFTSSSYTSTYPEQTNKAGSRNKTIDKFSLGQLKLSNVTVNYIDDSRQQVFNKQLDKLFIDTSDDKLVAEISGSVLGHTYEITFESESHEVFLAGEPWLVRGTGHIANRQTNIEARIQYKENELVSDLDFAVTNVDIGQFLDELEIIPGQEASSNHVNIKAKLRGKDLAELYEQAEVSLKLDKGYWVLQTTESEQNKKLTFASTSSFISWQKPVEFRLDGIIEDEPITINFKSNRLHEFFDDVQNLDIELVSSIASTEILAEGTLDLPINTRQFELDISIKGKDLEKLNPIINTDFPPFNDYSFSGKLIANPRGYILKSAMVSIGDTQLQASIVVETVAKKPVWNISLNSQQLQLKDFGFDDWNTPQVATSTEAASKQVSHERPLLKYLRHLEDTVKSPEMHLGLNMKVDKVLSGEDRLGKARLQLQIRDDQISIQNVDIELPGGRIKSSILLRSNDGMASGNVTLDIDKLDYGITTRLYEPESEVNGIISTRVELELGGSDFTRLLDHATGNLDIVVWPRNTRPTKAINLWTTNLYLILLPELKKKESLVNCLVGLLDFDDGEMKEELFAIDTTRLWVYGNIIVDFKQEQVELSLFPQSKTARLFSLQTPIRAQGSFAELSLSVNPIDITETYFSFITSPLHVPARRIFKDKAPEDGSAICERLFDREHVKKLKAEHDKQEKKEIEELLESD